MQQTTLVAGDTLDFLTTVIGYPATDGWTLQFRLTPRDSGSTVRTFAAVAEGADYRSQVTPATTATWTAGEYAWNSWVEKAGARQSVSSGQVTILPDPSALAAGTDTRSQAEKAVADLKAAYATFVGSQGHVAEYEIAGRRMKFASAADIVQKLSFWQGELRSEQRAAAMAAGLSPPNKVFVRF